MPETTGRHGFMDALPHLKTGLIKEKTMGAMELLKQSTGVLRDLTEAGISLLGLGGMRSAEKFKGYQRNKPRLIISAYNL